MIALFLKGTITRIMRNLLHALRSGERPCLKQVGTLADKLVVAVADHHDAIVPLLRFGGNANLDEVERSFGTAAIAASTGLTLDLPAYELRMIVLGTLFRDVGMPRSGERPSSVEHHVSRGLDLLAGLPGIEDLVLLTVATHHENLDGSGYPRGLAGDGLPLCGQIAAIAGDYEERVSGCRGPEAMEPHDALQAIEALVGEKYGARVAEALRCALGTYPAGSLVRLDNDKLAVVESACRNNPLMPRVVVFFDAILDLPIVPYRLDLARRHAAPKIVCTESFARWRISPENWFFFGR